MHNDLNRVILLRRWNSGDLIQRNTLRRRGGGATGSVRIKRDEFRENVRAFLAQEQSKLSVNVCSPSYLITGQRVKRFKFWLAVRRMKIVLITLVIHFVIPMNGVSFPGITRKKNRCR